LTIPQVSNAGHHSLQPVTGLAKRLLLTPHESSYSTLNVEGRHEDFEVLEILLLRPSAVGVASSSSATATPP